ncbi:MAG: hypothetical protein SOY67_07135 [Collinsella sp.]|nr:hypothetical protein [Collinsella sp.]
MFKRIIGFGILGAVVAAGSFVGYKVATDPELREKIQEKVAGVFAVSKEQLSGMSEDVAVKRAQLTRNPQINRDWVENQWEALNN